MFIYCLGIFAILFHTSRTLGAHRNLPVIIYVSGISCFGNKHQKCDWSKIGNSPGLDTPSPNQLLCLKINTFVKSLSGCFKFGNLKPAIGASKIWSENLISSSMNLENHNRAPTWHATLNVTNSP